MSSTIPLATITLMLWMIWSDSVRPRPMPKLMYYVRAVLFLFAGAALIFSAVVLRHPLQRGLSLLEVVAVSLSVIGAFFFFRRGRLR